MVRVVQSRTREVLNQPWAGVAQGMGLAPGRIVWRHAGRQVAVIAVTAVAVEMGPMLTALAVVEAVLDLGGLGSAVLTGIRSQQGPLVIGGVTTFIFLGVLMTLVADVAVLLLDPRQSRPAR
ncbi:MAG TPA: ABC transporter permease subunit [Euzebya sp.]|nr:ABC transporter permease subunit [Euzebya sp.]